MNQQSSVADQPSLRQRFRVQTRAAIKEAARQQIAEGGAGALSLNALAKQLGMAGPSLYRYFGSRDTLLTELLTDAYRDLADALVAAVDHATEQSTPADLADGLRRYAAAYRAWALCNPALYELLFGTPVPGYVAPLAATGEAASRSLVAIVRLVDRLVRPAGEHDPLDTAPAVAPAPGAWQATLEELGAHAASLASAVTVWTRLHGLLSLELRGHLAAIVESPELLYEVEVARLVSELSPSGGLG